MDKYLKLIKAVKEDKDYVSQFLTDNDIEFISLEINAKKVELKLSSISRFRLELIREEFVKYLKEKGLRY